MTSYFRTTASKMVYYYPFAKVLRNIDFFAYIYTIHIQYNGLMLIPCSTEVL